MEQHGYDNTSIPSIVLASASPRRRQLLQQMGIEPEVRVMAIDESPLNNENAEHYVKRVATLKVTAAADAYRHDEELPACILAADTAVVCDGTLLGKPTNFAEAVRHWQLLSDRQHTVLTYVALSYGDTLSGALSRSTVCFGEIPTASYRRYWQSGEPTDKAGAYAIQGQAAAWVERIEGSYTGIMGLPLFETRTLLRAAGLMQLL